MKIMKRPVLWVVAVLVVTTQAKNLLTPEDKDLLIRAHNKQRMVTTPEAANMRRMDWDGDLEDLAEEWTSTCKYRTLSEEKSLGANYFYRENLRPGRIPQTQFVRTALRNWAHYKRRFRHAPGCGAACPYVKMINALTDKIGCALNTCPSDDSETPFLVCFYSTSSNGNSYLPYEIGPSCSQCPRGWSCFNKLCVEGNHKPEESTNGVNINVERTSNFQMQAPTQHQNLEIQTTQPLRLQPTAEGPQYLQLQPIAQRPQPLQLQQIAERPHHLRIQPTAESPQQSRHQSTAERLRGRLLQTTQKESQQLRSQSPDYQDGQSELELLDDTAEQNQFQAPVQIIWLGQYHNGLQPQRNVQNRPSGTQLRRLYNPFSGQREPTSHNRRPLSRYGNNAKGRQYPYDRRNQITGQSSSSRTNILRRQYSNSMQNYGSGQYPYGTQTYGSGQYPYGTQTYGSGQYPYGTQTYGSGQYPYGTQTYGSGQYPYGTQTYSSGQYPYGTQNYGSGQYPHGTQIYGRGLNPYGTQTYGIGLNPYGTQTYGSSLYPHGTQTYGSGQYPYGTKSYGSDQYPYATQNYPIGRYRYGMQIDYAGQSSMDFGNNNYQGHYRS